jgi:hypothetical protein
MYVIVALLVTGSIAAWAIAAGDYSFAWGLISGVGCGVGILASCMAEASR